MLPEDPSVDPRSHEPRSSSESAPIVTSSDPLIDPAELVVGMVYGAGTDAEPVEKLISDCLRPYSYRIEPIHLSECFPAMMKVSDFDRRTPTGIERLQTMGDEFRTQLDDDGAVARLAVYLIAKRRKLLREELETAAAQELGGHDEIAALRVVWLVRSLRRPEEVQTLRQLYGSRFLLLGIHVPETQRFVQAKRRVRRWATTSSSQLDTLAMAELRRDEEDLDDPHGQAVRKTFSKADLIADYRSAAKLKESLPRLVKILFGDTFITPTADEQAMYFAYAASLRSAEMGQQVGAAITVSPFQCIAVGVNEVPSPIGRPYLPGDDPDGRDFALEPAIDSNTDWKRRIARELLARLAMSDWLAPNRATFLQQAPEHGSADDRPPRLFDAVQAVPDDLLKDFLDDIEGTRLRDLIEFGRAVHAEMDAITCTARRGIAIDNGELFTTFFPCHSCTRHIIASGIKRVVFLHPYPKSLAYELHGDAIAAEGASPPQDPYVRFDQFTGVAPRWFSLFFEMGTAKRKRDDTGEALRPVPDETVLPRPLRAHDAWTHFGHGYPTTILTELEAQEVARFTSDMGTAQLHLP